MSHRHLTDFRQIVIFFTLINLLTVYNPILAQETPGSPPNQTRAINRRFQDIYRENMVNSFFGREFGSPVKTLLSADLASNFIVFKSSKVGLFFVFTPRVKVSIFDEPSTPVRSPSFLPGGTLYIRKNRDVNRPEFFTIAYNHHSNGQSGPALNPDGTFNRRNGNFTTNYYTFKYNLGKVFNSENQFRDEYYSFGVEAHSALLNRGYELKLKHKYGFLRLNGSWTYNILKLQPEPADQDPEDVKSSFQRLQLDLSYIVDTYNGYSIIDAGKRLNITAKYHLRLPFMENVALMVATGYKGQDDYNIFFQDSYPFVRMGIVAGAGFSRRSREALQNN